MDLKALCTLLPIRRKEVTKLLRIMKLTAIILLAACLQVCAKGYSQTVTLSLKDAPLEKVFSAIEKQTGYYFTYTLELLQGTKPVNLDVKNASLQDVLAICLKDQPITYQIIDKAIIIKQEVKKNPVAEKVPPIDVHGRVVNDKGEAVEGATVTVKGTNKKVSTDADGRFVINGIDANAVLVVSAVNIETYEINVAGKTDLATLTVKTKIITGEVVSVEVNTGYQKLKLNEVTGSVVQINNELINRSVSTDILSRIQGITSGLLLQGGTESGQNLRDNIVIRGYSTIFSNRRPLIVVDNFPMEIDINSINPNDVESITVLKDAAAASIWGTRAGNGVIVITTKNGHFRQSPKVSINNVISIGDKTDPFYAPVLNSSDIVDIETFLFNKGYYNSNITSTARPALSPAIEILLKRRNGQITSQDSTAQIEDLKRYDVRNDLQRYYNTKPLKQQYAINLSGGSINQKYFLSFGFDRNLNRTKENNYGRVSINGSNTYSLLNHRLEITSGIWYSQTTAKNIGPSNGIDVLYPYERLADQNGAPLPISKRRQGYIDTAGNGKLLDWNAYPLKALDEGTSKTIGYNYRISTTINYKILKGFSADLKYLYEKNITDLQDYYSQQSYYARDLINQFTNLSQTTSFLRNPIPIGGILDKRTTNYISQSLRGQLNYSNSLGQHHRINAIIGTEMVDAETTGSYYRYYGYNKETSISTPVDFVTPYKKYIDGTTSAIPNNQGIFALANRFISVYGNAAYTYKDRYTFSVSGRRDGANIFGASTNNKWKPLWSTGFKWEIDKENFYNVSWLPNLNLRATYGYQGNINNNSVAALLTISYLSTPNRWNLPYATISNYPNPDLRWEQIRQFNIGIDYGITNDRITGSIEYYRKTGIDLIGDQSFPPSSGVSSNKTNSADIKGKGFDIVINTKNLVGHKFRWSSSFLFSYSKDWVTDYKSTITNVGTYITGALNPIVGRPITALYSYKWGGLDPTNGDPQGYIDGQLSKNYSALINSSNLNDMVYSGPTTPTYFGSMLNSWEFGKFSLSVNITYKLGYYFRRNSINYNTLFTNLRGGSSIDLGHTDYLIRWQNPKDELVTNVPSLVYPANSNRDAFYNYSEILVEKGDHIRLQDIKLNYDLNKSQFKKLPFQNLRLYIYVSNLAILWKANKQGIDPDYLPQNNYTSSLPGKTIAGGFKIDF